MGKTQIFWNITVNISKRQEAPKSIIKVQGGINYTLTKKICVEEDKYQGLFICLSFHFMTGSLSWICIIPESMYNYEIKAKHLGQY